MTEKKKLTQADLQKAGAKIWQKAGMHRLYLNSSLDWLVSEYPDLKAILTDKEELSEEELESLKDLKPYLNLQSKNFAKIRYDRTDDEDLKKFFKGLDEKLDERDFLTKVTEYPTYFGREVAIKSEDLPLVLSLFIKLSKGFNSAKAVTDDESKSFSSLEDFYSFLEKTPPKSVSGILVETDNFSLDISRDYEILWCRVEEVV